MKTFAQKIDELLKEKDINTIQLADILGISQSLVSQWLLGQKKTTKFLAPLPKFSGYPIEYFVNDNIETPDQIINNIKDDKNDRQKAIEGAIYVCRYDNELLVKRFKKRPHCDMFNSNTQKIFVDSANNYRLMQEFVRQYVQGAVERIQHYQGEKPLFELYHVEQEINQSLKPRVDLNFGGYLIIETH